MIEYRELKFISLILLLTLLSGISSFVSMRFAIISIFLSTSVIILYYVYSICKIFKEKEK
jgi:hypothetical protein